jgi:O-antigen ligase
MKSEKRTAKKMNKSNDFVAVSVFVYLLDRFADWFYASLVEGFFGKIFTAYSAEQKAFENSFLKHYFTGNLKLKEYAHKLRAFLSRNFENSYLLKKFTNFIFSFKTMSIRSYGNFWMAFGIYTIIIYFVKMFVPALVEADIRSLIVGIIACICALPMLFSKGTLLSAVGNSVFTKLLFSEAFGYRDETFSKENDSSRKHANFMILFGMICGVLTLLVDPIFIPSVILGIIVVVLIFSTPEIGILLSIFLLPFFSFLANPTISLSILVLLTFLSYVFKIIRGKRIIKIELIDVAVLVFGIMIYFGGVISVGGKISYLSALLTCSLMIGYFLVVNLMRTQKWLNRCFIAFVSSATLVSIVGIFQYFFGTLNVSWLDRDYFPDIKGRVSVLFENSNVLSAYLVMVFPLVLCCFLRSKGKNKTLALISSISIFTCVIFTWSRGAWLALIFSILLYFLIYSKKTIRFLCAIIFIIPFAVFILPDNIVRRFMSIGDMADSSISYRVYTWKGTFNAIRENLFGGVGYGTETYREFYPTYSYAGMETAEHSHSLYLQIWFSLGIVGLIIFAVLIFLFVQQSLENIKITSDIQNKMQTAAVFCSIIAALIMGAFDYIWYNYRVFYVFWIMIALSSAYARVDRAERRRKNICYENDSQKAFIDIE